MRAGRGRCPGTWVARSVLDVDGVGGGDDDFDDGGGGDGGHLPSDEEQSWRQSSRSFSNEDWHKRRSFLLK